MAARRDGISQRPGESPKLGFRRARPEDVPEVLAILSEAAAWAKARGVDRWWPVPFPVQWIRTGVERSEVFVIELESRVIGTITLRQRDPLMWGERPPDAGYVHRLAIRRQLAHRGFGEQALDWAASEVKRWGRGKLRLDCLATNESLVRYYLDLGFREVGRVRGNIPGEDRPSILMERAVE